MQALLARVPCLPRAAPPELVEGEETGAWRPGWGTGKEESQDAKAVSKMAANKSSHQPANKGRWVAPISWSKPLLGCAECPPQTWTPLYLSSVSPGTVVPLVLRNCFAGVLPGPSRFGKAFTALALPLLPLTISDYLEKGTLSQ